MARHARVLLSVPNVAAHRYNEIAWRMATESNANASATMIASFQEMSRSFKITQNFDA